MDAKFVKQLDKCRAFALRGDAPRYSRLSFRTDRQNRAPLPTRVAGHDFDYLSADGEGALVRFEVEAEDGAPTMEIRLFYRTKTSSGELYTVENPAIMVLPDGEILRFHGDFYRFQDFVDSLPDPESTLGGEVSP